MKKLIPAVALAAAALFAPLAAQAQNTPVVVDGTAESAYGAAITTQDTATGFGDSTAGTATPSPGGSELDAAYGVISNGTLYITLAGNLENNYNRLSVFIDSAAGGQNTLTGNTEDGTINNLNGLKFDTNFSPDYDIDFNGGGNPYTFYVGYTTLVTGGGGVSTYLGSSQTTGAATTLSGGNDALGVQAAINNSNTAGVGGTGGSTSGAGVTTGIEFGIPLSAIGNPTGPISIAAFIASSDNTYLSNQVLGGIGGGNNLASPAGVDFSAIAGNQFFTVTPPAAAPEPGSLIPLAMGALALGGLVVARRRTAPDAQ